MKLPLVSMGGDFEEREVEVNTVEDLITLADEYEAQISIGYNQYERISASHVIPPVFSHRWELTVIDSYD